MSSTPLSSASEIIGRLVSRDGYCLHYRVWTRPEPPDGVLVLLNGVMSHSAWFRELAGAMVDLNLCVIGADRRGSGLNEQDRGNVHSRSVLLRDLHAIIEQQRVPNVPVYLAGWCWGGVLAVHAALEFSELFRGLILIAPGLFPSQSIIRVMQEQESVTTNAPLDQPCLRTPIQEDMFTNGPQLNDFILKDQLRLLTFTPRFWRIMIAMRASAERHLPQLTQPVLLILARRDLTVRNEETLNVFTHVVKAPVTSVFFDCQHGVQFEAPQLLASHIYSWLKRVGLANNSGSRKPGDRISREPGPTTEVAQ
jgi:acylglycerol lipase